MLLSDALKGFIFRCRLRGLSDRTIQNYVENVQKFIYVVTDLELEEASGSDVEQYIVSLMQRNVSKNTVATYLRDLRVFLRYLDKEYKTDLARAIVFPRTTRRLVTIYTVDEIKLLYASLPNNKLKERNTLILSLMLDCGLRRQEVCDLLLPDIDFDRHIMKVIGKGDKMRWVPFGRTTEKQIRAYLAVRSAGEYDQLLLNRWGRPIKIDVVKMLFQRIKENSGLDVSAHKLRHNFATNYLVHQILATGSTDLLQLQIIMGHSDSETTAIYLHLANEFIALANSYSFLDEHFGA